MNNQSRLTSTTNKNPSSSNRGSNASQIESGAIGTTADLATIGDFSRVRVYCRALKQTRIMTPKAEDSFKFGHSRIRTPNEVPKNADKGPQFEADTRTMTRHKSARKRKSVSKAFDHMNSTASVEETISLSNTELKMSKKNGEDDHLGKRQKRGRGVQRKNDGLRRQGKDLRPEEKMMDSIASLSPPEGWSMDTNASVGLITPRLLFGYRLLKAEKMGDRLFTTRSRAIFRPRLTPSPPEDSLSDTD